MPSVFGLSYLDVEAFRSNAKAFGVGMSLNDFPNTDDGNKTLADVLAMASRDIDAHCGRSFEPATKTEQQKFVSENCFKVNNFPIQSIESCRIEYSNNSFQVIPSSEIYINNQQQICEITSLNFAVITQIQTQLTISEPIIKIQYKSFQAIPPTVAAACGHQAAHRFNTAFVDAVLPPNFGKVDIGDLSVNNKKGYKSAEEVEADSFSPAARRLLAQFISIGAST